MDGRRTLPRHKCLALFSREVDYERCFLAARHVDVSSSKDTRASYSPLRRLTSSRPLQRDHKLPHLSAPCTTSDNPLLSCIRHTLTRCRGLAPPLTTAGGEVLY